MNTDLSRDFIEGTVSVVTKELASMWRAFRRFVPDKEIEMAVIVEVPPGSRLRGVKGQ